MQDPGPLVSGAQAGVVKAKESLDAETERVEKANTDLKNAEAAHAQAKAKADSEVSALNTQMQKIEFAKVQRAKEKLKEAEERKLAANEQLLKAADTLKGAQNYQAALNGGASPCANGQCGKSAGAASGGGGGSSGSGGGGGSGSGSMPMAMSPPPPPPSNKSESSDSNSSSNSQSQLAATTPAATPSTSPSTSSFNTDAQSSLNDELMKQIASLNIPSERSTSASGADASGDTTVASTSVAAKAADDLVSKNLQYGNQVAESLVKEAEEKIASTPASKSLAPSIESTIRATSNTSGSPSTGRSGLGAAMVAGVSGPASGSAPSPSNDSGALGSRVASLGVSTSGASGRRAMHASPFPASNASAAPSEENTEGGGVPDLAALLGGAAPNAESEFSGGMGQESLSTGGGLSRPVSSRLVNPNAPVIPGPLRAVMSGNRLVSGTARTNLKAK
jgi:hypothetical protein